jgi:hypothetical protein
VEKDEVMVVRDASLIKPLFETSVGLEAVVVVVVVDTGFV